MPKDTILGLCDLKVAQRESKQTIAPSGSRYGTIEDPGSIFPQI